MKYLEDKVDFIEQEPGIEGMFKMMEKAARICYKTENLIKDGSAHRIIEDIIIPSGHTSVLEFGTVYLKYNIFQIHKYLKYIFDRYSRVRWKFSGVYVTTTYRTIMQGGYKDPVEAIENKFDKDWKSDLKYWCEPTKNHHKRYCFKFIMDRVGSQSVERHRGIWGISYAQESTRFVNYAKNKFDKSITFSLPSKFYELIDNLNKEDIIRKNCGETMPFDLNEWSLEDKLDFLRLCSDDWRIYEKALEQAEKSYLILIDKGWKPEDARGVLNLDVKTEFMMCAYTLDWKMWLFRRLEKHAHPHIQKIAKVVNKYFENIL
jgi:thymidylate synthase (FAD)